MRGGRRGGTELIERKQGGGMIGPMIVGDGYDNVNDYAKMKLDTVDSPAGKQTNNFSCSSSV